MKTGAWMPAAGAALAGALLAVLAGGWEVGDGTGSLSTPAQQAGAWLRGLSLSGPLGNLAAWLITLLVCALPFLLVVLSRRWHGRGREDWLAVLMVPVLFFAVYCAVNPGLLPWPAGVTFPLAAGGFLLSLLAAWLVLKVLRGMEDCPQQRGMEDCPQQRLLGALAPLLTGGAMLLAFGAAFARLTAFLVRSREVAQGNTGDPEGALFTSGVLLVLALLELVPYLLGALTLLWGARLARSMVPQLFSPQASQLCLRTAEGCRRVIQAGALLSVFSNLLQLVLLGALKSTRFSVSIPLFPLLLAGTLFLLCRLLQRGQELQEDSDSII